MENIQQITDYFFIGSMEAVSLVSSLITIGIGLLFARYMLYYFDRVSGINFKRWFEHADSRSIAIYFSVRFAAVFWFCTELLKF